MTAHRARKALGQNFLVDPNCQRRIVAAVDPGPDDEILEIGPGLGAITRLLAGTGTRFTVVELDSQLAARLEQTLAGSGTTILNQDFLTLDLTTICARPELLKVVGNIPYNITTPILFHLLDRRWRPALIVIMVQKEVAQRILAPAGSRDYGALSVGVRSVARVERLFNVGRRAFRPMPNVDSTVLRITPLRPFPLSEQQESDLRTLTRTAFGWRRKQLQRIFRDAPDYRLDLADLERLEAATGFDLTRRIETFEPADLLLLTDRLRDLGWPRSHPPAR